MIDRPIPPTQFTGMNPDLLERAVKLFTRGEISVGRAARIAGLDREAFMQALGERGIPVVNDDAVDLDTEIALLNPKP